MHLISLGHTRIGYVGGHQGFSSHRDRLRGFEATLTAAGLAVDSTLIRLGAPRPAVGRQAVRRLMQCKTRPTALILGSSELTMGALEALAETGVRWPDDVSVVGYGDPGWYVLIGRGITTIRLPIGAIADATAERVTRIATGTSKREDASDRAVERFATTLVVRGSTSPPVVQRTRSTMLKPSRTGA